jgi:hypothetical protein
VVITTQNQLVTHLAKSGGEIKKLFVSEGTIMKEDEVVAIIGSTCKYEDVKELNIFFSTFDDKSDWNEIIKTQLPPPDLSMEEIQGNYTQFQKGWKQMKDYLNQGSIPSKLDLLDKQIEKKTDYNKELVKQ